MAGLEECVNEFVNREAKIVETSYWKVSINRGESGSICSILFDAPASLKDKHLDCLTRLWEDALGKNLGRGWNRDDTKCKKILKVDDELKVTLNEKTGTLIVRGTGAIEWAEKRIPQIIKNYQEDSREVMGATGGDKVMPTTTEKPWDEKVDRLVTKEAREPQTASIGVQTEPTGSTGICHGDGVDDLSDGVARMSLTTSKIDNVTVTQYSDGTIDVRVKNVPSFRSGPDVGPSERNVGGEEKLKAIEPSGKKKRAKVLIAHEPERDDELQLAVGDIIEVLKQKEQGWWEGSLNGKQGSIFVEILEEGKMTTAKEKPDGRVVIPKVEPIDDGATCKSERDPLMDGLSDRVKRMKLDEIPAPSALVKQLDALRTCCVMRGPKIYELYKKLLGFFFSRQDCEVYLVFPFIDENCLYDFCGITIKHSQTANLAAFYVRSYQDNRRTSVEKMKLNILKKYSAIRKKFLEDNIYPKIKTNLETFHGKFIAGIIGNTAYLLVTSANLTSQHVEFENIETVFYQEMEKQIFFDNMITNIPIKSVAETRYRGKYKFW